MKKIFYVFLLLINFSCSSTDDSEIDEQQDPITVASLEISSTSGSILADSSDTVTFSVIARDKNQNTIQNSNFDIYIDGNLHDSSTFSTNTAGQYNVYAKMDLVKSNTITITAEEVQVNLTSISLNANTSLIITDGNSKAELSVIFYDENNSPVDNVDYEIVDNDIVLDNPNLGYTTTVSGIHDLKIQAKGIESNTIQLNARVKVDYPTISVPVIFHIVHFGESIGSGTNLSQGQVTALLDKLNKGFSNQYNSENPNAVDTKIVFRLANLDSNDVQLPEPGINRIDGSTYDDGVPAFPDSFDIANDKKLAINEYWNLGLETIWDPKMYLNLWIGPDQEARGSASLPWIYESYSLDGLVSIPDNSELEPNNDTFPSFWLDTNNALTSTAIIHEVGHSLGLLHVFSNDNCTTSDYCQDTYSYIFNEPNQPCSDNLGGNINDNFMDYTGIYNTFSYEQRERIHHVFEYGLWLNELKNSNK